jgi:hypothetical protein
MLLKVLSLLWLSYGAPFAQDFSQVLSSHQDVTRLVKAAILEANSNHGLIDQLEAKALSRQIVHASQCFDIDPMVFTALIWRESHFKQQSQSETGAVGLTQLTTTGIHEVLDRVASESPRKRESLRDRMSSCYPKLLSSIPPTTDIVSFSEWKKKVAHSPETALVFGAVLLKINFQNDYRVALEKYNGDARVKARFATDVLTLATWISTSFMTFPEPGSNNSKFLASIQSF